jgi:hypothetical protein
LISVLREGFTAEYIENVIAGAVDRWKSGWGTKKVAVS